MGRFVCVTIFVPLVLIPVGHTIRRGHDQKKARASGEDVFVEYRSFGKINQSNQSSFIDVNHGDIVESHDFQGKESGVDKIALYNSQRLDIDHGMKLTADTRGNEHSVDLVNRQTCKIKCAVAARDLLGIELEPTLAGDVNIHDRKRKLCQQAEGGSWECKKACTEEFISETGRVLCRRYSGSSRCMCDIVRRPDHGPRVYANTKSPVRFQMPSMFKYFKPLHWITLNERGPPTMDQLRLGNASGTFAAEVLDYSLETGCQPADDPLNCYKPIPIDKPPYFEGEMNLYFHCFRIWAGMLDWLDVVWMMGNGSPPTTASNCDNRAKLSKKLYDMEERGLQIAEKWEKWIEPAKECFDNLRQPRDGHLQVLETTHKAFGEEHTRFTDPYHPLLLPENVGELEDICKNSKEAKEAAVAVAKLAQWQRDHPPVQVITLDVLKQIKNQENIDLKENGEMEQILRQKTKHQREDILKKFASDTVTTLAEHLHDWPPLEQEELEKAIKDLVWRVWRVLQDVVPVRASSQQAGQMIDGMIPIVRSQVVSKITLDKLKQKKKQENKDLKENGEMEQILRQKIKHQREEILKKIASDTVTTLAEDLHDWPPLEQEELEKAIKDLVWRVLQDVVPVRASSQQAGQMIDGIISKVRSQVVSKLLPGLCYDIGDYGGTGPYYLLDHHRIWGAIDRKIPIVVSSMGGFQGEGGFSGTKCGKGFD